MVKHMITIAAVLLCSTFAAGEVLEQPHIIVYGTAQIQVKLNEMNWLLNVRNEAKELPATAAAHAQTVQKVLEFLKSHKIDEDKLQTSHMQFGENWKYLDRERVKVGYYASTGISFTISDFDLYQKFWYGLAQIEGVSIQNISYAHSERIRYQNQTREKALLAAREKAVKLAATLGSQIGEPLIIEETVPQSFPVMLSNTALRADMGEAAPAQSLAPGQLTISTNVRIVFKLKN